MALAMDLKLILIVAVLIGLFQLAVCIFIWRRDDLEKEQKIAQSVIAWLIPFFAALGLLIMHRSHDKPFNKSANKHDNNQGSDPSVDL